MHCIKKVNEIFHDITRTRGNQGLYLINILSKINNVLVYFALSFLGQIMAILWQDWGHIHLSIHLEVELYIISATLEMFW